MLLCVYDTYEHVLIRTANEYDHANVLHLSEAMIIFFFCRSLGLMPPYWLATFSGGNSVLFEITSLGQKNLQSPDSRQVIVKKFRLQGWICTYMPGVVQAGVTTNQPTDNIINSGCLVR